MAAIESLLAAHFRPQMRASHSHVAPLLAGFEPVLSGLNKNMATPGGLQPPTSAFGKPCSMRLSYGATRDDLAVRRAGGMMGRGSMCDFGPGPGPCRNDPVVVNIS